MCQGLRTVEANYATFGPAVLFFLLRGVALKKKYELRILRYKNNTAYMRVSLSGSMNVRRLKGIHSRGIHGHVRDSCTSICSWDERSRLKVEVVRNPSEPASNTIHLKGGRLRFIPLF